MTTRTLTLADPGSTQTREQQFRALEARAVFGRRPCCGATNPSCSLLISEVFIVATGCSECGHSKGCHS